MKRWKYSFLPIVIVLVVACEGGPERVNAPHRVPISAPNTERPRAALTCSGTCPESDDPFNSADPGYVSITTPGPGARGGFSAISLPGSYSEPTYVYARATGVVSKWYANSWVWPVGVRGTATHPLDPDGWAWGSAFQCVGNLQFYHQKANGYWVGNAFCTRNSTNLVNAISRSPRDTFFVLEGSNGNISRANSMDQDGPNCGYLSYPACYDYAGIQTVEFVPYRKTLQVNADRDSIGFGDSLAFTASASAGAVTIRSWVWRSTTGAQSSVSCSIASTTCSYAPPNSGRMYVVAKVGTNPFVEQARSVLVKLAPKYKLECLPSPVTRGSNVSCEVTVIPGSFAASTTVSSWVYESSGSPNWDLAADPPLSLIWAGKAVQSGTVTATLTTTGFALVDLATPMTVSARPNWQTGVMAPDSLLEVTSTLLNPPDSVSKLGRTEYEWAEPDALSVDSSTSGPNMGASYLLKLPTIQFNFMINRAALSTGSTWLSWQTGISPICTSSNAASQLGPIMAHEGMGKEANSHSRLFYDYMNGSPTYRPLAETVVSPPGQPVDVNRIFDTLKPVYDLAVVEGKRADANGTNNWTLNCILKFTP